MKISDKASDWIMIFNCLAWVGCIIAAAFNFAWAWFFVVMFMPIMLILNGSRHNGVFPKKMIGIPFLGYCITFIIAMIGEVYFHVHFMDQAPTFTILGMHPSEFFLYFFYWIGGMLTIGVGTAVKAKVWCPDDEWDEFMALVEKEGKVG